MEIATLGIRVENGQVIQATASLEGMTVAGTKAEASTQRLTRRMALAEIEARKMDAAMAGMSKTAMMATQAFGAFTAVAALGFIGRETIKNTIEAQNAMAQLEAAVKSTGGAAGRTVAELDALSMQLQRQTTYSDEAVKSAEAMLLTFDRIRGTEFDRATAAITDLAARMGGDLQGAAVQVGKALQDPTMGLTALRRSGVSFSQAQIEVIKKLYETGQVAEGQRVILAELEHQFGGSAAAARDTLGGALEGLKNAFGDLFEVTRGGSQGAVNAINSITSAMERSGLTMSTILADAAVDWETMRTSISKVSAILAIDISKGNFLQQARDIIHQLDEELLHFTLNQSRAAKVGAAGKATAATGDADRDAIKAAKKQHDANVDLIRDAQQAADLAGLEGDTQARTRIAYEATNKVIDAQRRLKGELLDETIAAIRAEEEWKNAAVARASDMNAANKAMKDAKDSVEQFGNDLSSKLATSLSKVFGRDNPLRGLFETLAKDLLKIWSTRFLQPMAAAMIGMDTGSWMGKNGQGGIADASQSMGGSRFGGAATAGVAGLGIGYGIGGALYSDAHGAAGNNLRGAIGGGLSGAAAGAAIGMALGPLGAGAGAIIGGISGVVGGLLGMGSASKAAAKAMTEAIKQVQLSMDSLRAKVHGDTLEQSIAAVEAERKQLGQAIEDAWSGGDANSDRVQWRTQQWKDLNQLEDAFIAKLREEYATKLQRKGEDFDVRYYRAIGDNKTADALAFQHTQDRERQDLITSFGSVIDSMEAQTLADYDRAAGAERQKFATDQNTKAINALTAGLNEVQGYKTTLQGLIFDARGVGPPPAAALPPVSSYGTPGQFTVPTGGSRGTPAPVEPGPIIVQLQLDGRKLTEAVIERIGGGRPGGSLAVAFGEVVRQWV